MHKGPVAEEPQRAESMGWCGLTLEKQALPWAYRTVEPGSMEVLGFSGGHGASSFPSTKWWLL